MQHLTRADALLQGVLVDVTDHACEMGFEMLIYASAAVMQAHARRRCGRGRGGGRGARLRAVPGELPFPELAQAPRECEARLLDQRRGHAGGERTERHHQAGEPGLVVAPEPAGPVPVGIVTGEGVLGLLRVQMEGRRAMAAEEFLRGARGFVGARLPS